MSTRKASNSTACYMRTLEYAELRGINGNHVATRAALVDNPAIRSLLWYLQAKSLEPAKFRQMLRDFLSQYADRIGTPSMHKFGTKPGQIYKAEQVKAVRRELPCGINGTPMANDFLLRGEIYANKSIKEYVENQEYFEGEDLRDDIEKAEKHPTSYPVSDFIEICHEEASKLADFIIDLCVNPLWSFEETADYRTRLEDQFPGEHFSVRPACLWWFKDVVGALLEYKRREEESARADFVLTEIGEKVWDTLDYALKSNGMVVCEGLEGRGKSEAAAAWVRCHLGQARFIKLTGVATKTSVFQSIARELGIQGFHNLSASILQGLIQDVLHRSQICLVLDEAHFCFQQTQRFSARPEILDWIDTALCNNGVPVALVTTPQFIRSVKKAELQVGWNWRQFRRRVKQWETLPQWNRDADLEAVAKKLLPGITRAGLNTAIGYAKRSFPGVPSRDISGLGDLAQKARIKAQDAGRANITAADILAAFDSLNESDQSFAAGMLKAEQELTGRRNVRHRHSMVNSDRLNESVNDDLSHAKDTSNGARDDSANASESVQEQRPRFTKHRPGLMPGAARSVTPVAGRELAAA